MVSQLRSLFSLMLIAIASTGHAEGIAPYQIYPWTRAHTLVKTQPRTVILPLTRNTERESSWCATA